MQHATCNMQTKERKYSTRAMIDLHSLHQQQSGWSHHHPSSVISFLLAIIAAVVVSVGTWALLQEERRNPLLRDLRLQGNSSMTRSTFTCPGSVSSTRKSPYFMRCWVIACLHQIFATFLKSSLFGTTCPFPGPCWARTARSISAWFSRIAANMLTTVP